MSIHPLHPPGDLGRRLLPTYIDQVAANDPTRHVYSFMRTADPSDGFHDVSAKAFAQAVNRCAWHLEQNLGRGADFPALLYMGPQDLMYPILTIACIKTGYKVLFISPLNTLDSQLAILHETDCNTFLMPPGFSSPMVKDILSRRKMDVLEIPGYLHWINDEIPVDSYPYTKTWEDAALEPFVVLHTSGSTGSPKPVILSHKTLSAYDAFNAAQSLGFPGIWPNVCKGTRVYFGLPFFHLSAVILSLHGPWFGEFTAVSGPFPPSVDVVDAVHAHNNVQHSVQSVKIWTAISQNSEFLNNLEKLDGVVFSGGPCPEAVGNAITKRVQVWNCIGATETGLLPSQPLDSEDWAYFSPSPLMKHEFRPVADDLYELLIVRDPDLDVYQGVFGTFPELKEYSMKDLYSKHLTKPDLWLHRGRADDIVVLSTGQKIRPLDMEDMLLTHPSISGVVVAGYGCAQPSLLIEPKEPPETAEQGAALLNELWPAIEAANNSVPPPARVHREMVTFTSRNKPMPRAGKGTVQRKLTLDVYADELNRLYSGPQLE